MTDNGWRACIPSVSLGNNRFSENTTADGDASGAGGLSRRAAPVGEDVVVVSAVEHVGAASGFDPSFREVEFVEQPTQCGALEDVPLLQGPSMVETAGLPFQDGRGMHGA